MKITIEPTDHFFMLGTVMVRAWRGVAENDELVVALISAVVVAHDASEIPGLVSIPPPSSDDALKWAKEVMRGLA